MADNCESGPHSGTETPFLGSSILCNSIELPSKTRLRMEIVDWSTAAIWRWTARDDCGICRNAFDACCAECTAPGDQCPLVWGKCSHAFHLHCINQWCEAQTERPRCPMCRQVWLVEQTTTGGGGGASAGGATPASAGPPAGTGVGVGLL